MSVTEGPGGGARGSGVAPAADSADKSGLAAALGAYASWGLFPILFHLLGGVSPLLVVAHRIVWSFLLVGSILTGRRRLSEVTAALRSRTALRGIVMSALLLSVNWLLFVGAVHSEKVLEASFGYFINPLVSVGIGMALLGERMRPMQLAAVAIALFGIAVQALALASIPYISLGLALSFGFYGYFRKTVPVGSAAGLFVETLVLLPVALGYMGYSVVTEGWGPLANPATFALLVATGPVTSFSLLLFAYGAKRLPLRTIGMLQYVAPSLQFLLAILAYGEPMNAVQLVSFVIIWISLCIYSVDLVRRRSRPARATTSMS